VIGFQQEYCRLASTSTFSVFGIYQNILCKWYFHPEFVFISAINGGEIDVLKTSKRYKWSGINTYGKYNFHGKTPP